MTAQTSFIPFLPRCTKEKRRSFSAQRFWGGLKTPHNPSELIGGDGVEVLEGKAKVLSSQGQDVTSFFLKGAEITLDLAKKYHIRRAILKSKSPSCGCGWVFDGVFSKKLIPGYGVTAALLKRNGMEVLSDVEYLKKMSRPSQVARNTLKSKNVKRGTWDMRRKTNATKK